MGKVTITVVLGEHTVRVECEGDPNAIKAAIRETLDSLLPLPPKGPEGTPRHATIDPPAGLP